MASRVDRVDPELLALMERAGCHHVYYGIESGHPETLGLRARFETYNLDSDTSLMYRQR
ncbi:MAG: hypothetical protein FJ090_04755 [Deltaproteobacteria bacterium]|nr:hypothetical protein [Deltaproteobacteria bacterium]